MVALCSAGLLSVNLCLFFEGWFFGLSFHGDHSPSRKELLAIHDQYYQPVYAFFARRRFARDQCQDLAQETFLRVYRNIGTVRSEASLRAWIFTIAASVYKHWLRERSTAKRDAPEVPLDVIPHAERLLPSTHSPLNDLLADEELRMLRKALDILPDKMRRCMLLRVDQDLRYREIADEVGISIDTVKAHLHQAKKLLKAELDGYFEVPDFDEDRTDAF